ncbi:potassium channel KAT3-like protein [Tanacetum coccineum]
MEAIICTMAFFIVIVAILVQAYVLFCGGGSRMVTAGVDRSAAPIVPVFLFAGIHPGYAVIKYIWYVVCDTLQRVISMDGNTMPQAPIQALLTQTMTKRCATHCYIARNIHYLAQFMKITPLWPPTSRTQLCLGPLNFMDTLHEALYKQRTTKSKLRNFQATQPKRTPSLLATTFRVWSILKPGFMALLEDTIVFYVLPPSNEDKEYQICTKHSRNVLDMNAHSGGFNFALLQAGKSAWVMNVVLPGSKKTINKSLSNKDEINVKVPAEEGQTAHHVAVNKGHLEMVMIFLDGGANVSKADVKGSTPKPLAKKQENKSIYDLFLPVQIKSSASYVVEASSSIRFEERGIVNKETAMASQPLDPIDNPVVDTDAQTGIR